MPSLFFKKIQNSMQKILFGALTYESQEEYLEFLKNLDGPNAVAMLVAAAAYAQGKGIFSMEESEVLVNSVRKILPQDKLDEIMSDIDKKEDKNGSAD